MPRFQKYNDAIKEIPKSKTSHLPDQDSWEGFLKLIDKINAESGQYRMVKFDTINVGSDKYEIMD